MLCNRFLVAPQFCINSLELAELGELNYFWFLGEGSVTKELGHHLSVVLLNPLVDLPVQYTVVPGSVWLLHHYLSDACEATVPDGLQASTNQQHTREPAALRNQ